MYADVGRISGLVLGDLMDEAIDSARKWSDSFDDRNTLNDWVTYIIIYLARAAEFAKKDDLDAQYKALIKAMNLCGLAATRVRGDTPVGSIALRHYDAVR